MLCRNKHVCTVRKFKTRDFSPRADLAAAEATRGSTTEARNATVLITGFPAWLKGTGW